LSAFDRGEPLLTVLLFAVGIFLMLVVYAWGQRNGQLREIPWPAFMSLVFRR
jgi:hypothetical protein